MGFYAERILPVVIDYVCGSDDVGAQRRKVVPLASGRVLEIGMGTAHNLSFYDVEAVEVVWGLEPSPGMRRVAADRIAASPLDVRLLDLPGEEIPLDDDTIDTVVLTFTLCSIPDWRRALDQVRRVLAPGGRVVFAEHGESPDPDVQRWQRRLTPAWKRVAGGCHLDRPIGRCFEDAGFVIDQLETEYRGAPRFASYTYTGVASPS